MDEVNNYVDSETEKDRAMHVALLNSIRIDSVWENNNGSDTLKNEDSEHEYYSPRKSDKLMEDISSEKPSRGLQRKR